MHLQLFAGVHSFVMALKLLVGVLMGISALSSSASRVGMTGMTRGRYRLRLDAVSRGKTETVGTEGMVGDVSEASKYEIAIYTDGACKGNKNVHSKQAPAGWGVVVVDGMSQRKIMELFGPVVLDKSLPFYMNAIVCSNNTAELTAIGEALLWLRDFGHSYPGAAVIRFDSEYAAKSVQGIFNGKKNLELIKYIREVLREVRAGGRELHWEHVKGHSGDEMNERADYLAGLGALGTFCQSEGSRYEEVCSNCDE